MASASRCARARSWASPGVAGNGQDELVEAITGLRRPTGGTHHARRRGRHPVPARAALHEPDVAFVPADRHRFGLVLSFRSRTTSS